jgi:hypothetical protein
LQSILDWVANRPLSTRVRVEASDTVDRCEDCGKKKRLFTAIGSTNPPLCMECAARRFFAEDAGDDTA